MKSVEETKREKKIKEDLKQWEEFGVREQECSCIGCAHLVYKSVSV